MKPTSSALRTGSLFLAIAGFGGLGLFQGCVISLDEVDCTECDSSPLCHNHVGADGLCYCDSNYSDPNPDDDDLGCEEVDSRLSGTQCTGPGTRPVGDFCYCEQGYRWCSANEDDFSCCLDPTQDSLSGTTWPDDSGTSTSGSTTYDASTTDPGTTTDPDTTGPTVYPPPDSECQVDFTPACSNDDPDNVEGSVFWSCQSGSWIEAPDLADEDCQSSNYDFAYGCFSNYEAGIVEFVCGDGPGTPCTLDDDTCVDSDTIQYCLYGRLTEGSCTEICGDPEEDITYSYGECADQDGMIVCHCCDEIDEDGHCIVDEE